MSAEKTLAILDLFDFENRALTVSEIAKRLNQPVSSSYRHLRVLKDFGYVMEASDGKYRLGYRFLKMARIVRSDNSLMTVSRPIMEKLMEETEETIILSVRSNFQAVCLDIIASLRPVKVTSVQGGIVPLHCGATSKALLVSMGEQFIDTLFEMGLVKKYTEHTLTDKKSLMEDIDLIRRDGYSFSDSELDEGVVSYGVPLHDYNGNVVASLGISGPRERMFDQDRQLFVDKLKKAGKEIEQYI